MKRASNLLKMPWTPGAEAIRWHKEQGPRNLDVTGSTKLPLTAAPQQKSPGLRLSPESESLPKVTWAPNVDKISILPLMGCVQYSVSSRVARLKV